MTIYATATAGVATTLVFPTTRPNNTSIKLTVEGTDVTSGITVSGGLCTVVVPANLVIEGTNRCTLYYTTTVIGDAKIYAYPAPAANYLVLSSGAPTPPNLPDNTVIFRYS